MMRDFGRPLRASTDAASPTELLSASNSSTPAISKWLKNDWIDWSRFVLDCAAALFDREASSAFDAALVEAIKFRTTFGLEALDSDAGKLKVATMIAFAPAGLYVLIERLEPGLTEGMSEWTQDILERHLNSAFRSGLKH